MEEYLAPIEAFVKDNLWAILVPIVILIGGWLLAVLAAAVVRRVLRRTDFLDRTAVRVLGKERARKGDSVKVVGKFVYYIFMLITLVVFLDSVKLTAATEPINAFLIKLGEFAPKVLGAAVILLFAWVIAVLVRKGTLWLLDQYKIEARIGEEAGTDDKLPISKTISEAVYWLIFLLFLPAVLGTLELDGLLEPVNNMLSEVMQFIPNLVSAAIIFLVGWFAARIVQRVVTNVMIAVGAERLSERIGVAKALGERSLSELIGLVVHILILLPVAVSALDALQLAAITGPASEMLSMIFTALPALFGAALVLGISYIIGRAVAGLVANVLGGAGFDSVLVRVGLAKDPPKDGESTPSTIAGQLVLIAIILLAFIEAARLLGFTSVADVTTEFLTMGGHVLLGLVIFGVGLFLANVASHAIHGSGVAQGWLLSAVARVAIIVLAGAIGLRQMGLADDIITLGFGLILGSIAVAAALAFGLGGREAAAVGIEQWRNKLKNMTGKRGGG